MGDGKGTRPSSRMATSSGTGSGESHSRANQSTPDPARGSVLRAELFRCLVIFGIFLNQNFTDRRASNATLHDLMRVKGILAGFIKQNERGTDIGGHFGA